MEETGKHEIKYLAMRKDGDKINGYMHNTTIKKKYIWKKPIFVTWIILL